ncbi:MAG: ABA4-like family protein [Oscillatoriaceae bacterium SKW80]|nr:ABA4-like family protein [Oscillatoriaceae bacterium SKYG93]MCX8120124.1 ABA4-like family protein [Oscillatoriaceae bacterium SKW80]MDW8453050.1 ABA4-like family protein [Oscillatoriaceae cyanobacterium SKYGB_i_bin93]HIK29039.1 DUF4281 domain-containing protein [Oscillatoriaceae cyanobacterium M7585_C2015_266]
MTLEQLFNCANLFVLPFWTLMIILPNWGVTKRVIQSYIPFLVLAILYLFLLSSALTAENAQALANPKLADIAQFFANERATATGWIHFLVMDLFVGRWIYLQGQQTGVWTIHSLLLCLFAGPLGLLSHIITDWVSQKFFPRNEKEATPQPTP